MGLQKTASRGQAPCIQRSEMLLEEGEQVLEGLT
jgi:hypothetical protein